MDFVAQELEEGDQSTVVHIPSGAKFQVFLSSEVHIAQHQCQATRPRLQPIGLGVGEPIRASHGQKLFPQINETFQENKAIRFLLTPPSQYREMPTEDNQSVLTFWLTKQEGAIYAN